MNGEIVRNSKLKIAIFLSLVLLFAYSFYRPSTVSLVSNSQAEVGTSTVSILVVGDMMLDRNVRNTINRIGFDEYFKGVKTLIQSVDIAVVNLEGAFTTNPSITASLQSKELQFTFDPKLAPKLANLGFDVLGLANNHSYNFGKIGLESTRRYIGSAGMLYYGDPFNKDEISTIVTRNGIRIAFVGFHEFYYTDFDKVFFEVARLRKDVDIIIVSPHWGPEYEKNPTPKMQEWAHQFIDYGADAVIGTHSHIVGATEEYKGKKIYYSLGNFAFDQYFSEATMNGLAVEMKIEKRGEDLDIYYKNTSIQIDRDRVQVSE